MFNLISYLRRGQEHCICRDLEKLYAFLVIFHSSKKPEKTPMFATGFLYISMKMTVKTATFHCIHLKIKPRYTL